LAHWCYVNVGFSVLFVFELEARRKRTDERARPVTQPVRTST